MSERGAEPADEAGDATVARSDPSAGRLLRQAREAAGLHIGALSVALKVPVKKLEALEADRHDLLPDAVFARALAASVCRTLKVDPGPILGLLPNLAMPRLELDSATTDHTNLQGSGALWRFPLLERLPKPVWLAVGALMLGALTLWLYPSSPPERLASVPGSAVSAPGAAPVASPVASPVPAADAAVADAQPAQPQNPASAGQAGFAVPPPAPARAEDPKRAEPAPAGAVLALKATGASWVEVTDSAGVVHIRRTLTAGETAQLGGALPLSVVVGRADAVEVQVRGQTFGLASVARDNVARFQVK